MNTSIPQEYLAERMKVSRQAVSKWENDVSSPDTNNLIQLAELFGVSVEYLATGKEAESLQSVVVIREDDSTLIRLLNRGSVGSKSPQPKAVGILNPGDPHPWS